jgi:hypothetical protein
MNLNSVRNVKLPNPGPAGALAKVALLGGLGLYGAMNSLYNVDGGHRAIVFNRLVGVKDRVISVLLFEIAKDWSQSSILSIISRESVLGIT